MRKRKKDQREALITTAGQLWRLSKAIANLAHEMEKTATVLITYDQDLKEVYGPEAQAKIESLLDSANSIFYKE